jgi:hypothetical protein
MEITSVGRWSEYTQISVPTQKFMAMKNVGERRKAESSSTRQLVTGSKTSRLMSRRAICGEPEMYITDITAFSIWG